MQNDITPAVVNERSELDPQLIERFLDNQARELELRAQEHEINKQKDNNSLDYAKRALQANVEDRKHDRECKRTQRRELLIFAGAMGVLMTVMLGYLAFIGKEAAAIGFVKEIVPIAIGLLGAYGYGRSKTRDAGNGSKVSSDSNGTD